MAAMATSPIQAGVPPTLRALMVLRNVFLTPHSEGYIPQKQERQVGEGRPPRINTNNGRGAMKDLQPVYMRLASALERTRTRRKDKRAVRFSCATRRLAHRIATSAVGVSRNGPLRVQLQSETQDL